MLKRHINLLAVNHDFLVEEMPMDPLLEAIKGKNVLSLHDLNQLKTLRHQGRKALARYLLAVLPFRGSLAFKKFLECLQEAEAQHIVDLLLQQSGVNNLQQLIEQGGSLSDLTESLSRNGTPSETLTDRGHDPHEYAVRLSKNASLIRESVEAGQVSVHLTKNKVMTVREDDLVKHIKGTNKQWEMVMAILLQRGERAYQAFMACLLQNGHSELFQTIQETNTAIKRSDSEENSDDDKSQPSDEELDQETEKLKNKPKLPSKRSISNHGIPVNRNLENKENNRSRSPRSQKNPSGTSSQKPNKGNRKVSNAGTLNSVDEQDEDDDGYW